MNKEEKEEILKASDFLFELDKSGYKYSCYGREIYIRDNVFRVIDKLQKENTELKEENIILEGNKIGLKFAIQELKEELDYYKQKESQEFDERDYYEE